MIDDYDFMMIMSMILIFKKVMMIRILLSFFIIINTMHIVFNLNTF